ncbi:MAG: hypothetical protein IJY74_05555, partial [Oscillospiraceae bacterium]|nr:hypothetical protein [Oscillospiraceae bacterium]
TYDLNKLDDYVLFSDLEPGVYTYQVIASTNDNDNLVLTKQSFTVKAKTASSSSSDTPKEESSSSTGVVLTGGTSVPASIKQGAGVVVKGKLTSDNKITAVTVGVYDKNSKRVTGKTVYPSAYSYDISKLDEYILFSELDAGTYSYQVIAADAYNKNQVLSKQSFTVKASAKASSDVTKSETTAQSYGKSVTLTNASAIPAKIKVGESVDIKGTITSSSKMTTVTVAVFDIDGKRVTGKTVYPSALSYDLSKLDSYVNFHKLDAGLYTFEIIAANADSENHILVNKTFRVVK